MIKSPKHPFNGREIWNDGPEFEDFMGRDGAPAIARKHLACGGGKSGTGTQNQSSNTAGSSLAQAEATTVWNKAYDASNLPFQSYTGQFVSPINAQQNTGISGINSAAGMYAPYGQQATQTLAPYFGQATQTLGQGLSAGQGLTGAGVGLTAANANLNPNSISQWESPYIQNVVQATENQQNQQNQQQQSQLEGSAIQSGAFGGDRSGVAAANLAYQQNLANQPTIANLYNTGYQQALGAAQQQQQTGLSAGAQLGNLGQQLYSQGLGGSQQYANLGSGLSSAYSNLGTTAQTNALNAAQAQLGAGTLQQQTGQAQDTAQYNQFLQQQAYPFQTSQFLSNILNGVAPIYGTTTNSTGTATQPMSFFQRGGRVHRDAGGGLSAEDYKAELSDKTMDTAHQRDQLWRKYNIATPMEGWDDTAPQFFRGDFHSPQDRYYGGPGMYKSGSGPEPNDINLPPSVSPLIYLTRNDGGRVGRAGGGGLSSANDNSIMAQILAAHAGMYPGAAAVNGSGAGSGPYGLALSQNAPAQLPKTTLPTLSVDKPNGARAAMQDLNVATKFGENVGDLYSGAKKGLVGSPAVGNTPASGGWAGYGGRWGASPPMTATSQGSANNVVYLDQNGQIARNGSGSGLSFPSWLRSSPTSPTVDPTDYNLPYQRGGRVGLAYGGIPYADQINDPIVPADIANPMQVEEAQQSSMSRPGSGMSVTPMSSGLGKGLGQLASIASMFMEKGGRVHKDEGGGLSTAPQDVHADNTFDKMLVAESGNKHFDDKGNVIVSPKGAVGVAQVMPGTGPIAAKLAGVDWDAGRLQSDPDYNKRLGKAYYDEQKKQFGDPLVGAAAYNAGPEAVKSALARAQKEGGSYLAYLPTETQDYVRKVGGGNAAAPSPTGLSAVTPQGPGTQNVTQGPQSWWDKESGGLSGTERAIITALSGLGGMASSPSRFFGGALLSGLGAGANTYAGLAQKGMGLDISQQQANTAQTGKAVEVAKFWQGRFEPRLDPKTGATMYFDKLSGTTVSPQQYQEIMSKVGGMLPGNNSGILSPTPYAPPPIVGGAAPLNRSASGAAPPVTQKPLALPDGTPIQDAPPAAGAPAPTRPASPSTVPTVEHETDPTYLFGEANRLNELAQQADAIGQKDQAAGFRSQAEQMTKRATEAGAVAEKAKVLPQAQGEALKATYAAQRKAIDLAQSEASNAVQAKQQAQSLMGLMFDKDGKPKISGGPMGPEIARFAAMAQQAGFSPKFVQDMTGTDPAAVGALQKFTTIMGSELARQELAGSPVRQMEFMRFLDSVPSEKQLPEAFKWIIEHSIIPKADAQMGAYESIADADPTKDNVQKKLYEYSKNNPWARSGAPGETPARSGSPTAIPPANERNIGQTYTNANGVKAAWTGSGWRRVP